MKPWIRCPGIPEIGKLNKWALFLIRRHMRNRAHLLSFWRFEFSDCKVTKRYAHNGLATPRSRDVTYITVWRFQGHGTGLAALRSRNVTYATVWRLQGHETLRTQRFGGCKVPKRYVYTLWRYQGHETIQIQQFGDSKVTKRYVHNGLATPRSRE